MLAALAIQLVFPSRVALFQMFRKMYVYFLVTFFIVSIFIAGMASGGMKSRVPLLFSNQKFRDNSTLQQIMIWPHFQRAHLHC
jgi:hypothetical protein